MIYLTLVIPIITIVICFIFFRRKILLWEYALILVPSIIISVAMNFIMIHYSNSATEYLGNQITHIQHYDRWNEYIHQTCSRQVASGTDSDGNTTYTTEYYDCSYVKNHPEYWVMIDPNDEYDISKYEFDSIRTLWNTQMIFVDMKRNYHTIDGDAQRYTWNNNFEHSINITTPHSYQNKVQSPTSYSIFKFEDLDKIDIEFNHLMDYPKIDKKLKQQVTILCDTGIVVSDTIQQLFKHINGWYGPQFEFRYYVLLFNTDYDVTQKQRSYWKGGNKNEFNICIGIDSISQKIKWFDTFTWSDDRNLSISVERCLLKQDTLNLKGVWDVLFLKVPSEWKRKNFSDFDYIQLEITLTQFWIIFFIIILYNVGVAFYVICNEYSHDNIVRTINKGFRNHYRKSGWRL